MTAAELLADWDAGKAVWSIEMGGIGPGYEQAIQVLVVELVRDELARLAAGGRPLAPKSAIPRGWGEAAVARMDELAGGYSGAQVAAARTLAAAFVIHGPDRLVAEARAKDRAILVSRFWPKAGEVRP